MADVPESTEWTPGIYQWETSDPVLGGPEGIDNLPTKQLANRTRWLKDQIEKIISGATAIGKAVKLATARTISISGAATGSTSFDGSANAAIALTLADSGAVAGTYAKVTISAKGLVVSGSSMVAADIPSLDWSKIATGKPSTLAGYGITDSVRVADKAGQDEAEAGTDNTKWMTPLRVFQAIVKVVTQATEVTFGWAKVATQTQVDSGTDDSTFITPKKMRMGFTALFGSSGYVAFPSWLQGWIFQWGAGTITAGSAVTVNLPIPFPNTAARALACHGSTAGAAAVSVGALTLSSISVNMTAPNTGTVIYFAVGR